MSEMSQAQAPAGGDGNLDPSPDIVPDTAESTSSAGAEGGDATPDHSDSESGDALIDADLPEPGGDTGSDALPTGGTDTPSDPMPDIAGTDPA